LTPAARAATMQKSDKTNVTIAIIMITTFITPFMGNAINLAIPAIGQAFGSNQSQLNWVLSSYLIATAAFLLPSGRLADQIGRRKVFLAGMILLALSSLACALAVSLPMLVIFRIIQGIASAMIFGNAIAILTSVVPPQKRGKALGLVTAATYVGLSAGPVLGGLITGLFSWRGIFVFILILVLAVIVVSFWQLKGEWVGEKTRTDRWGIVLCIAAQGLLLYGLSGLPKSIVYQACFAAGIILLVVFYQYEKRFSNPLLPVARIFSNRLFTFSNLASLINYSATAALSYIISLYLQSARGIDTSMAGLILLVQPIIMALLSPLAGSLSDRLQPAVLASVGMGMSTLGLAVFIFLTPQTSLVLIILNMAWIGVGFAMFSSPNTNAIMGAVDKNLYGVGSSMMNNARLLGQSISMAILSMVMVILMQNATIGSPDYAERFMASSKVSFIIFTVLCALGVAASLVRGRNTAPEADGATLNKPE
jgi:EmrB/QacA subfamily drug resistance transporter